LVAVATLVTRPEVAGSRPDLPGVTAVSQPGLPPGVADPGAAQSSTPGSCAGAPSPRFSTADQLLRNVYIFESHPAYQLAPDLTWREDPFHDRNWRFKFHSLMWVEPLWLAWEKTGDVRYRDRYVEILRSWFTANPRSAPRSADSWNDHATAWRGMVYACALRRLRPTPGWLLAAATVHGRTLADDGFYVHHGNHALDQSIGLLELGCTLPDAAWRALARDRMETLVRESVDHQGVSNEQSEGYHGFNYRQYVLAIARLNACGLHPSAEFASRVALMPPFAAFEAIPTGRASMIGNTGDVVIPDVAGTETRYVLSGGRAGLRPATSWATYDAGYAFFRSGWGETRPLDRETSVTVRFGPPRAFHGHSDAAAVTLAGYGDRILLDSGGPHDYNGSVWHTYVLSERAHNTVTVDGLAMSTSGTTRLIGESHGPGFDYVEVEHTKYRGITHVRRVFYDRRLNVLVVDDHLTASRSHTFRQLWHLHPAADPVLLGADGFATRRRGGPNVWMRDLTGEASRRIVSGVTHPLQGWVTFTYGHHTAAPVAVYTAGGRDIRFLTVIVPSGATPRDVAVAGDEVGRDGFALTLSDGNRLESISVVGAEARTAWRIDRLS
jgi:hypothetical protein